MPEVKDPVMDYRMCPERSGLSQSDLKTADKIEFIRGGSYKPYVSVPLIINVEHSFG